MTVETSFLPVRMEDAKLVSIKGDCWLDDDDGRPAFKVSHTSRQGLGAPGSIRSVMRPR